VSDNNLHSYSQYRDNRKELRKTLTPAEATLWNALKSKQLLNRKFTKQHSIEHFIVDFYCPAEKLVVELDGQGHFAPGASYADSDRDARLMELGFKILRFENKLVFQNLEGLLADISAAFSNPQQ
jgi:very-short-patch-repair endonuclease